MKKAFCVLAALSALAVVTPAFAAGNGGGAGLRAACRDDVKDLCNGIQPGGGRIIGCLQDHADQLSQQCAAALPRLQTMSGVHGGHPDENAIPPTNMNSGSDRSSASDDSEAPEDSGQSDDSSADMPDNGPTSH